MHEGLKRTVNAGRAADGPIVTVNQFEERHPAMRGRMRQYIMRSDAGVAMYAGLGEAVIRIGRSVMLDEAGVLRWLGGMSNLPKSRARNPHGRAGKGRGQR